MQSEKPTHRYKCYAMGTFKRKRTRNITKIIRVHHKTTKTHLILVYIYVCNRNIKLIIHKMKKKLTSENKHFFTF